MNDYPFISATDARKNFSETFSNSIYVKPQIIKRNRNDAILMPGNVIYDMLENLKIELRLIKDNDGSYYTDNDILPDIIGYGDNKDKAIDGFVEFLDTYAHYYYDHFESVSKTEKGKKELPYVFKVICSPSLSDLKEMLICHDGKN